MSAVCTIGLDLAKQYFQVHGVNSRRHVVLQKKVTRQNLLNFFAQLPKCIGADRAWQAMTERFEREC